MKIQKVKIRRFKVLENIEEDIKGNNIFLLGDNEVGKSSFIQFIKIALGDKSNIPPEAEGAGYVVANKNGQEYTFKVQFKNGKPVVEVSTQNGMKDVRKSVISEIVGGVDFDIDEFVSLADTESGRKKQVEIYKELLDTETRDYIRSIENDIKSYYDDRTDTNRQIKSLEGFIKQSPVLEEDDIAPVDVSQLQTELSAANEHNEKIADVLRRKDFRDRDIEKITTRVEELEAEILALKESKTEKEEQNKQATEWLSTNSKIDTEEISQKILKASDINTKANQVKELRKSQKELFELQEKVEDFTAHIEAQRVVMREAIKEISGLVDGLHFNEEHLLYNNIPVSTASLSTSQIMHLGIKMKMCKNPDLGILFIERGESLGKKRLEEIVEMAKQNDWQLIVEQVDRGTEELKIEIIGE